MSEESVRQICSTNQNSVRKNGSESGNFQHETSREQSGNSSQVKNLISMFEEKRSELVYDFKGKVLNPNRLRATDYSRDINSLDV